ncbi:MAG: PKD domain-containing protein, partial [Methanosarcinaceae archaeon]|nr:PKD domain-containing protein [Methanosarcinaceae archaeon]
MRKYVKFALIGLLILGLFCGGAMGATLDANFSANVTSGDAPLTVYFTDMSINATSWEWDVGDGTANYTTQNVTHTYNSAGTYTVTLKASNSTSNDTEIKNDYITVLETLPVADFSSNVTSGDAPLTVYFTDQSTNATSWIWDVGDGTANYTTQNVTHTYNSIGEYGVSLAVFNSNGTSSKTVWPYITVSDSNSTAAPVANFTSNVTSGLVPLTVNFTDLSTNASSWSWDIGDGTYTTQNVTHTYNSAGTYDVSLTVSDLLGNYSTKGISNYITVSPLAVPIADFSTNVTEGIVPLTVKFTDLSTNTASWNWNIGDGTANYTTQNVTHTYNLTGTYTVNLTATNPNGSSTKTITINVHPKTYYTGDRIWD